MHIYITGGSGFVGSAVANYLVQEHKVTIGDINPLKPTRRISDTIEREKIDVTDSQTMNFDSVDVIIHLVALSPLWTPPAGTNHYSLNVKGTKNVINSALNSSVDHIIHISALGASKECSTAYMRSKGMAEDIVEESRVQSTIFRPSLIFGEKDELLSTLIQITQYIPFLPLPLGGKTRFQPIAIDDIVSMIAKAVKKRPDTSFNIAGPQLLTLRDLASLSFHFNDRSPRILPIPRILVKAGAWLGERTSLLPFGMDQYRALEQVNTLGDLQNHCELLGISNNDLKTVKSYLKNNFKSPNRFQRTI